MSINHWVHEMTPSPTPGTDAAVRAKPGIPVVRALERGLDILRAFSASKPRLTLTQLSQATGLDKGTTRRLLHTLQRARFVRYDEMAGHYSLSIEVLELTSAVETGRDLHEIAAPYLGEIAEQTNATTFLWVPYEGMALCIDRVRVPNPQVEAVWFTVGTRTTLNAGAGPRVLLAHISDEEREIALSHRLERRTPTTETNPDALRLASERIRAQGWELATDDFVLGLAALGVPIFDSKGKLVGALSLTGLTSQILPGPKREHLDALFSAAREISSKLS